MSTVIPVYADLFSYTIVAYFIHTLFCVVCPGLIVLVMFDINVV